MKKINNILVELYKDKDQLLILSILCFISYWLETLLPNNTNVIHASAALIAVGVGAAVNVGVSMFNGAKNRKAAKDAANKAAKEKRKQMALLNQEKAKYEQFEFKNPYAKARNEFQDLENTAEDLTVNQQEAEFQAQQGAQQRSNIMEGMRGAAGGSGIAGLAQAMAGQGQLQTQKISASIGQQEVANQRAAATQAARNQQLERTGEQTAAGQRMKGDEMVARQEADRRATLLGMQASMAGGAAQASRAADQMSLETDMQSRNQTTQAITSGVSSMASAGASALSENAAGNMIDGMRSDGMSYNPDFDPNAATGGTWNMSKGSSDRKLKKNIKKISKSPSGLNIYSFEFKDSKYGEGLFQGVMSDEVPKKVVTKKDGYDMVDYSKIDVEFKKINK